MKYLKYFENHTFNDLYKRKNKWINISKDNLEYLKNNFFTLVDNAYSKIGDNNVIKQPDDIFKRSYWESIDDNTNPDADAVLFGKKTKFGIKITGIGHDGSKKSKEDLLDKLSEKLKVRGYYIESSGSLKKHLEKKDVPYITDIEIIKKVFPESNVQWIGNGTYIRTLKEDKITDNETLFGKPKMN